jgi:hypothetical protein
MSSDVYSPDLEISLPDAFAAMPAFRLYLGLPRAPIRLIGCDSNFLIPDIALIDAIYISIVTPSIL